MTSKAFVLDLFLIFALALFIRLLGAWPQQQPNYMDAAYSYVNAVNLVQGRGFVEDFVWNYLDDPPPPPHPSHLYWMPFTSILAGLGMMVGGVNYRAAQIMFIILSALLAPITYWIAYSFSPKRRQAWLAGLLTIFSGFYVPFWTAIDNFTPFAVAGALALLFAWRGIEIQNPKSKIQNLIVSGLFIGLAHLSRADGPLLFIAIILTCLLRIITSATRNPSTMPQTDTQHASHTRTERSRSIPHPTYHITFYILRIAGLLVAGYFITMLPWFIRNWQVAGIPLPGGGTQSIWLVTYDDLFSYGRELSARTFLAQGFGSILRGRWWALTTNLQTIFAVWGMIFLGPLALVGAWHRRHHVLIQLVAMYALLLFTAMTLVFAFPGARGGLFHSGAALLSFIYALAVVGLDDAVAWAAAKRRGWKAQSAKQVFGVGLVVLAIALSSFIYYQRVLKNNAWNRADSFYPAIATWVIQQNPSSVVMIGNPPAYRYHGGGLSVVIPNENVETTLQAARDYQVDYLVLDGNHPALLTELYENPTRYPELSLVKTFAEDSEKPIYIFEIDR